MNRIKRETDEAIEDSELTKMSPDAKTKENSNAGK